MSKIEWTDETWNPLIGCRRVSPGCEHCYAERQAIRMAGRGQRYEGIVSSPRPSSGVWVDSVTGKTCGGNRGPRWTGASTLVLDALDQPLRWTRPRMIFVDSMSDLFFEGHNPDHIACVFGVMLLAGHHTFQVLTKRPERARLFMSAVTAEDCLELLAQRTRVACTARTSKMVAQQMRAQGRDPMAEPVWPPPHIWIGTSAEDQERLNERLPALLQTRAAVHFLSYEPALGPLDLHAIQIPGERNGLRFSALQRHHDDRFGSSDTTLDWVIAGSESGAGARPAELNWFRVVRDQCATAGVPFFFKQWVGPYNLNVAGEKRAIRDNREEIFKMRGKVSLPVLDDRRHAEWPR